VKKWSELVRVYRLLKLGCTFLNNLTRVLKKISISLKRGDEAIPGICYSCQPHNILQNSKYAI